MNGCVYQKIVALAGIVLFAPIADAQDSSVPTPTVPTPSTPNSSQQDATKQEQTSTPEGAQESAPEDASETPPSTAQEKNNPASDKKANSATSKKPPIKIAYEGAPKELLPKFKILSTLTAKDKIFPTTTAIRRAARRDADSFTNALVAAGYFSGRVTFALNNSTPDEPLVRFMIEPGPAFAITQHKIVYDMDRDNQRPATFEDLNINVGTQADGASLLANQQKFLQGLWDNGYPTAKITARRAEADFDAGTAFAVYQFNSGPRAFFGAPKISGLTRTKEDYIRKLTTWEEGALYDKSKTISYRDALSATNLFGAIDVAPGSTGTDGQTPILVHLQERKHRTIGTGLSFSTSEGPGARLFFENRNLFKRAERLRIDFNISQIEQSATALLEKPLISLPGVAFVAASFVNETTDAFDARTFTLGGGLSKSWFENRLETRGGITLENNRVIPANGDPIETNSFISFPLTARWNNEDDLLNPTKGVLASLSIIPTTGSRTFTQIEATARTRVNFGPNKRFTTAVRGRIGSTLAIGFNDLPVNKRFFSGGGGSVRGYGFQLVGPLEFDRDINGAVIRDENDDILNFQPTGGRSVIEAAFEARYRVTQNIQVAAFVDAGSVSRASLPDFTQEVFVGAGAGVRYFTPVGPIRIDFAIPVNKREVDAPLQFLISLGQSF